jgi:hypothetical protein
MKDRKLAATRLVITWLPLTVVLVGTGMVLVDFTFNYIHQRYVPGVGLVRFFAYEQLYDLTLHLSMLAVGLAGALICAAVARSALRGSLKVATTS